MKRTSFFWVLVLEGLVGLHRTVQLQLLQHYWSGHRLGLPCYWMVCLGNEQRSFCHFWDCIQTLVYYDGYSISSKGFLPTVVDIMIIWVNSPIPVHFSSLIPKMSMFTLAISYLTPSNLPWFMDLTFHVPMQYCSLQHRTLLLSPVTSTTGFCLFFFGSISSFFLELFISSSILGTYWPGEFLFQYPIILPFNTVHGVLKARILKWFAIPFSSGPHCVRPLHHACPSWVAPQGMA